MCCVLCAEIIKSLNPNCFWHRNILEWRMFFSFARWFQVVSTEGKGNQCFNLRLLNKFWTNSIILSVFTYTHFHVRNNSCNISLQLQYLSYARAAQLISKFITMETIISYNNGFRPFGNYFLYCLELSPMEFSETFSTCENGHNR